MQTFIMLVGLPGSGKSTFAQIHKDNAVWLSSDKIREKLFGNAEIQKNPSEVFDLMKKETKEALLSGQNVIYDACNINSRRRRGFLSELGKIPCQKICYIMATPYEVCLRQNKKRNRVVPEEAIQRMYYNFQTPFYHEGWDEIHILYHEDISKEFFGNPFEKIVKLHALEHDNPHHKESVGKHMANAYALIQKPPYREMSSSNLAFAALFHDIGKEKTKVFHNTKGEETEIAHYYHHENVGAYDIFFYDLWKPEKDLLEISLLINLHMKPFNWNASKQLKILGEDLYNKLVKLHEVDEKASEKEI